MYQLPMLMITRMIRVPLATKSPCAHSAPRPYGLSTVSLAVVGLATGAGAAAAGALASAAGAAAAAGAEAWACAAMGLRMPTAAAVSTAREAPIEATV